MNAKEAIPPLCSLIEAFLAPLGFVHKGKGEFSRKVEPHKREEKLNLHHRHDKPPHHEALSLSMICGIYYKTVNTADAKIEKDFLNTYPLVAGSIGYFRDTKGVFLSVPLSDAGNIPQVAKIFETEIAQGALSLFSKFPTLESLIAGAERKDPWLTDLHLKPDFRMHIRLAAMRFVAFGKEPAIEWFRKSAPDHAAKAATVEKMRKEWA